MTAFRSSPADGPRRGVNTRITDELREMLETAAQENGRSISAEIEKRLLASFGAEPGQTLRTIIRQEIEADRERQRQKVLAGALYHGNGNWSAMNRPAMAAEYDVRPDLPSHSHTVVACPLGNIHCSYHRPTSLTVAASEDAA